MLPELESISRDRPDRALRLQGQMGDGEALEVVIFRGFSSSLTHPTAFDPDSPVLPAGSALDGAELLQAPLRPGSEKVLAGPEPVEHFLDPGNWRC